MFDGNYEEHKEKFKISGAFIDSESYFEDGESERILYHKEIDKITDFFSNKKPYFIKFHIENLIHVYFEDKNNECSLYGDISAVLNEANKGDPSKARVRKNKFMEYLTKYMLEDDRIFKKVWFSI